MTIKIPRSNRNDDAFGEDTVYEWYLRSVNQPNHHDPPLTNVGDILTKYLNKDDRAQKNSEIWRGELPVWNGDSWYDGPEWIRTDYQALGKIVADAEFYSQGNWSVVRKVASRSTHTDF